MKRVFHSYAKVNLCLGVGQRLPNGYHEINSLMQLISLCDDMIIEKKDSAVNVCTNIAALNEEIETNTAKRAAELFFDYTKRSGGVDIFIEKNIPYQAGLGGSSSNAACTLNALDEIYETGLTEAEKCALALQIGADVPFFIRGTTAIVEGIGEKITYVEPLPPYEMLVVMPPFGISTPAAYQLLDAQAHRGRKGARALHRAYLKASEKEIQANTENTFECILESFEIIQEIKTALLQSGATVASLSGSGSAVFGVYLHGGAQRAYENVKKLYDKVFYATFVS